MRGQGNQYANTLTIINIRIVDVAAAGSKVINSLMNNARITSGIRRKSVADIMMPSDAYRPHSVANTYKKPARGVFQHRLHIL